MRTARTLTVVPVCMGVGAVLGGGRCCPRWVGGAGQEGCLGGGGGSTVLWEVLSWGGGGGVTSPS